MTLKGLLLIFKNQDAIASFYPGYILVVLSGFLWGISSPGLRHESRHLIWKHREHESFAKNLIIVLKSLMINWKVSESVLYDHV